MANVLEILTVSTKAKQLLLVLIVQVKRSVGTTPYDLESERDKHL
jgi:hypothetical protein